MLHLTSYINGLINSCEDKTRRVGMYHTDKKYASKEDCASRGNAETGLCVLKKLCRNLSLAGSGATLRLRRVHRRDTAVRRELMTRARRST